jgi:hypothetical protein
LRDERHLSVRSYRQRLVADGPLHLDHIEIGATRSRAIIRGICELGFDRLGRRESPAIVLLAHEHPCASCFGGPGDGIADRARDVREAES